MSTVRQLNFSGGEIAPSVQVRVDTIKYATALKQMRNAFTMRSGGATSRPGTKFVCEVKDSSKKIRLIPFVFNSSQTYVLEFGNLYMRVIKDGDLLTETAKDITDITQADPAVVTSAAHGYSDGEEVVITDVVGMTELNGRHFKVANKTTDTFELNLLDDTSFDSSGLTAYSSGGSSKRVYEITTTYLEADLAKLQCVQSADVVTITHPSYVSKEVKRTGDTSWTITDISFEPKIASPDGGSVSSVTAGSNTYRYKVTAIDKKTFEESLPGIEAKKTITASDNTNPIKLTCASHGYQTGDVVNFDFAKDDVIGGHIGGDSVFPDEELIGGSFVPIDYTITKVDANTFTVDNIDGTSFTDGSSLSSSVWRKYIRVDSAAEPSAADPMTISWTAVSGAQEYNVYKEDNGIYALLGIAGGTTFDDIGQDTDLDKTLPIDNKDLFSSADNYPSAVTYFQQRLAFGNSNDDPEKVWLSQTGRFKNFNTRSPLQDDDAITFTMSGRQVNEVRHLLDLGRLVILTSGGEHAAEGNDSGILTPTGINQRQYSYYGANNLSPIVIGTNALYVQDQSSIVRTIGFSFEKDGLDGDDLTTYASHLFEGKTLVDWCYQKNPHSIVWTVRSDGTLLGLTLVPKEQILAWHRHDFGGTVENVCAVPEGSEYSLYLTIKRTIDGDTKRYIEKMSSRYFDDISDFIGVDCAYTYDGRNTDTSKTMTLSGGTNWTSTETLTLTSSASFFTSDDVGNAIHLTGSDGTVIRFSITSYTSATVVQGKPHKTVPGVMRSAAISDWAKAIDTITGLWHLEGKDVSVFADGYVVASPNNESYDVITVEDGSITLDRPYGVYHIGLPYLVDLESLNVDTPQGETLMDKKMIVGSVNLKVEKSRGIWIGTKPPSDDDTDPLEGLYELKARDTENYDDPNNLITDTVNVITESQWNNNGRVFIRQVDPVPLTVLAIAPDGLFPFRGG